MSTKKYNIPKLQGDKNFTTWSIRLKALLTKEDLSKPLEEPVIGVKNDKALSYIKLLCEDGPLLYIATIESAYKAWERLKELYDPKGFTTEWITLREFFNTSLEHFDSMEEYLFRVKALLDNLQTKEIILPNQVIVVWVLNSLTEEYSSFVSTII